ncbi:MAG: hypothetical protein D6766_10185 [Verrucomicrobia bacterium]|nr:MAG: hypothetical protein D6766_10185 [Verrucomicrobiota bacterium]
MVAGLATVGGRAEEPAPAACGASGRPGGQPRHIIHLVADGMCWSTFTMGDAYARLKRGRGLRWLELFRAPEAVVTTVNMRSLNSMVTDSAAASSSWGSGSRVVNGTLNMLPDGRKLRPLGPLFGEAGWRRGLVTTTEITHATPAGFAATVKSRGEAETIAPQYLAHRIEVLLGGGRKFFDRAKRKDHTDLFAAYRKAGYTVVQTADELGRAPVRSRLLGTFAASHLPFGLDLDQDPDRRREVPTLAAMTRAALKRLEDADHFLLQVEGGRVDHGGHACDIAAALRELVDFDEALEVCLEFQRRVPETLLVITTDHGTGGPALNGVGSKYGDSSPLFAHILGARRSFEALEKEVPKVAGVGDLQRLLGEALGYRPPEEKAAAFLAFVEKQWKPLFGGMDGLGMQLGQLMANHYGVSWTSGAHTGEYVPLVALGPGAARFRGFQQNTDIFRHYTDLAGIDYRNPEAPLLAECAPSAATAEFGELLA